MPADGPRPGASLVGDGVDVPHGNPDRLRFFGGRMSSIVGVSVMRVSQQRIRRKDLAQSFVGA